MIRRNPTFSRLQGSYLFPEIEKRKAAYLANHPEADLLNFGIGDATLPLPQVVVDAMERKVQEMASREGFAGYGPAIGLDALRQKIAEVVYGGSIAYEEIVISDGILSDIGRLQPLFGAGKRVAVQDPSYPAYVDASVIGGASEILYLPSLPENGFFPDLKGAEGCDVLYFCSPNNPTGVACTYEQLEELVAFAKREGCLIVFDAAYAAFIRKGEAPTSIYDIPGARAVAIELGSFSKMAGFTGIRLGWSVVPRELRYAEGGSLLEDWQRLVATFFNGASRISQAGGMAVLTPEGLQAARKSVDYYLENARYLKEAMAAMGAQVYGGELAPYVWARFEGRRSWDLFEELLHAFHMVTIPGSGFGPTGEGFVRLSSFCTRQEAERMGKQFMAKA